MKPYILKIWKAFYVGPPKEGTSYDTRTVLTVGADDWKTALILAEAASIPEGFRLQSIEATTDTILVEPGFADEASGN